MNQSNFDPLWKIFSFDNIFHAGVVQDPIGTPPTEQLDLFLSLSFLALSLSLFFSLCVEACRTKHKKKEKRWTEKRSPLAVDLFCCCIIGSFLFVCCHVRLVVVIHCCCGPTEHTNCILGTVLYHVHTLTHVVGALLLECRFFFVCVSMVCAPCIR